MVHAVAWRAVGGRAVGLGVGQRGQCGQARHAGQALQAFAVLQALGAAGAQAPGGLQAPRPRGASVVALGLVGDLARVQQAHLLGGGRAKQERVWVLVMS